MSKSARKIVIPLLIALGGIGLTVVLLLNQGNRPDYTERFNDTSDTPGEVAVDDAGNDASTDETNEAADDEGSGDTSRDDGDVAGTNDEQPLDDPDPDAPQSDTLLTDLHAVAPAGPATTPDPLGSFDWTQHPFQIEFSTFGAGIDRITLSDVWNVAAARVEADRLKARVEAGEINIEQALAEMPTEERYVIQSTRPFRAGSRDVRLPAFVARSVWINGTPVNVYGVIDQATGEVSQLWSQDPDDPGRFTTEIRNGAGEPVLRVTRHFKLGSGRYDIVVEQAFENLTDRELEIEWLQYGPADLDMDRARYYDRRRVRIGHLGDPARGAPPRAVYADTAFLYDRGDVAGIGGDNRTREPGTPPQRLWPNAASVDNNYALSWFAVENRYFGVAIHPVDVDAVPSLSLEQVVNRITPTWDGDVDDGGHDNVAFELQSTAHTLAPDADPLRLDFAVFAGPLDPDILEDQEPYVSLRMGHLILYQMSACCAICTFQWLAHLLLMFLGFVEAGVGDWGVAIIALVVVVRLLLHPITKRSQTAVQKFQKAMQRMAPDIEKLKEKYKDDPKRMQQEQMRLYREHGVNPLHMLGCLPMFLQMPIWIALYAMLYFAWPLRQEPAFWGIFQNFGGWQFLADLSAGDHFFYEFATPVEIPLYWAPLTGINLLPILMGVIFYVQQKYMTPSAAATMSKEQQQTQKIMKVMMVVMMPVFLYGAPSGLTLYIMTSSLWGIIESRRIRKHVDSIDFEAEMEERARRAKEKAKQKKKKPKDAQARAYRDALERAKQKRANQSKKNYKKRK